MHTVKPLLLLNKFNEKTHLVDLRSNYYFNQEDISQLFFLEQEDKVSIACN